MAINNWKKIKNKFCKKKTNIVALIFLLILIGIALFAPYIAPYDPLELDYSSILSPPGQGHLLGTDSLGRDLLSRIIYGARISIKVGFLAMAVSSIMGLILGVTAGYYGGIIESIIMRLMDIMLSMPGFLLAMVIVAIIGPSITNVVIALGISSIPTFTRVVRGATLGIKEEEFIKAIIALGANDLRIIAKYIIPNILSEVIVLATLRVAIAIIRAAGLSFIGLGAQPPTPEWGAILSNARGYLRQAWWYATFPGLAISLTALSINLIGDSLRDILDPKQVD